MSVGAECRLSNSGPAPRRCSGFSLVEITFCLGIAGLLGSIGASGLAFRSPGLSSVQQDLDGAMYQAFNLARARGRDVIVAVGPQSGTSDVLPVTVPRDVRWGKPARIPLPPGMEEPKGATSTGEAHHRITVTPRHTVTATCWFLNDGTDALCFRLNGRGQMHILRWRASRQKWGRN